MARGASRMK